MENEKPTTSDESNEPESGAQDFYDQLEKEVVPSLPRFVGNSKNFRTEIIDVLRRNLPPEKFKEEIAKQSDADPDEEIIGGDMPYKTTIEDYFDK